MLKIVNDPLVKLQRYHVRKIN